MNTLKKLFRNRATVIACYALIFWAVLPCVLVAASAYSDKAFGLRFTARPIAVAVGVAAAASAAWLLILSIVQFHAYGQTLPISKLPPDCLIQNGLYAIWRHPIYLFYTLLFAGIGLAAGSGAMLAVVLPVFAGAEWLYIVFEERMLVRRHGQRYVNYRAKTPVIIPRLYQALRIPVIVLAKLLFAYEIRGRRRVPASPPFFVVTAHRNYFDPLFAALAMVHPISYVATYEMFRSPLSAAFFRTMFAVPRRRYVKDVASGKAIVRRIQQDYAVGLFPEGERSWTGETGIFKPEAVKLMRAFPDIPVVPVRIDGGYPAWPRWANRFRRAKIRITVREPLRADAGETTEHFAKRLALLIRPDDAGLARRGRGKAAGVERLLYRCPGCRSFDAFRLANADEASCSTCGLRIVVNPDCTVMCTTDGRESTQTLDGLYQRIKIVPHDLRRAGAVPHACASDSLVAESGRVMISIGGVAALGRPKPGTLRLTSGGIFFCMGKEMIDIPYIDIASATIEGNSKLQIYDGRCGSLYEAAFKAESALKWRDYIVEAVAFFASRTVNRF